MDAEAWEAVIPSMGAMALVRNLRNFDEAGIGEAAVDAVIAKVTDATEVAKARLFPYQVWAAYKHAPSDNWKRALGRTLDLTVANIPQLDGTLVVIDTSGSMQAPVSNRSRLQRVEVAAVMAMATAKRARDVDVVIYGQGNAPVRGPRGESVLSGVDRVVRSVGSVGHATYGHTAIARWFDAAPSPAGGHLHRRPAARRRSRASRPRPADLHVQPGGLPAVGAVGGRARSVHPRWLHRRHVHVDGGARAGSRRGVAVLTVSGRRGFGRLRGGPAKQGHVEAMFVPDADGVVVATMLTQGPWDPNSQYGGTPAALLTWAVEGVPTLVPMRIARITVDMHRRVPLGRLVVHTEIVREGKRLQVVVATICDPEGTEVARGDGVAVPARSRTRMPPPIRACPRSRRHRWVHHEQPGRGRVI